ncbi:hypothetical protein A9Q83_00550, partial [Alphaproteobacteria bacterium 46_93_T64]
MKNVILGTTALVAVTALTAGSVSAAEKIKLNVGGYLQTSFVVADYDTNTDQLPTNIRHEGEVHFTGKTTLDNGLEFGVNIQLEARESGDQVDETFMYVEGAFGRVNMGSENSASYLMGYGSPSPVPAWGLNSPNANAGGFTTPSTYTNGISDADKLTYFTPRMGGFQIGASYTPDADSETSGGSVYSPISDEGAADEAYSIAANYTGKFGGVSVNASAGWENTQRTDTTATAITTRTTTYGGGGTLTETFSVGSTTLLTSVLAGATTGTIASIAEATAAAVTTSNENTDEISIGGNIGVAGFTIGGAYKFTDNDGGTADLERHDYNLGVSYG